MPRNFQVRSQGVLWSQALERLLGVEKHNFGKRIVELIQKWSWFFFCHVRLPCESLNLIFLEYPSKKSQYHRNPYTWKIFMTIFKFVGQFFFQNDVFKLQEDFSELGLIVFLKNGIGSFQTFLILHIWDKREVLKRFQNQFWKQDSKSKKPRLLFETKN
jgi:hypothetical protein